MKQTKSLQNWMLAQGLFIQVTALWALLHVESFMWVTGPKTDIWLVKTVAVLGLCAAITLIIGSRESSRAVLWLGISISVGFAFLDLYYYLKGTITWTYLIDAALQVIFLGGYLVLLLSKRSGNSN